MILRKEIKIKVAPLHDQLENQYPFNFSKGIVNEEQIRDLLICFKVMFLPYLKSKEKEHEFYKRSYHILANLEDDRDIKEYNSNIGQSTLHLDYLFLGSRQGNRVLLNRYPELLNYEGGEFFKLPFPTNLWDKFLLDLQKMTKAEEQDQFIASCCNGFKKLIYLGSIVEN